MKEFTNVAGNVTSFARNVNFLFSLAGYYAQGQDLNVFQTFPDTIYTPKEWFLKKGRKRVKEWREVTFMKEWVKALYIGYHQALD